MQSNIAFTKMHGCGNDYIYVDAALYPIARPSELALRLSDRHTGIGGDGLVLIDRSTMPEADFSMRIFNADGSEATMCGNACRCVGKYLYERHLTSHRDIRLDTLSGIKTLSLHVAGGVVESVTVDMGEPAFEDEHLFRPALADGQGTFVSMGNPHYVIFTDDIDQVAQSGPRLEHHPAFPRRCNIEFARPTSAGTIRTRVWERGSGITQACGTGACATAVAACIAGRAGRHSLIVMDGGTLDVEWCEKSPTRSSSFFRNNHVYLTGPAEFVFEGEFCPPSPLPASPKGEGA